MGFNSTRTDLCMINLLLYFQADDELDPDDVEFDEHYTETGSKKCKGILSIVRNPARYVRCYLGTTSWYVRCYLAT